MKNSNLKKTILLIIANHFIFLSTAHGAKFSDGPGLGRRGPIGAEAPSEASQPVVPPSVVNERVRQESKQESGSEVIVAGDLSSQSVFAKASQEKQNSKGVAVKPWYTIISEMWQKMVNALPTVPTSASRPGTTESISVNLLEEADNVPNENRICHYLGYTLSNQELTDRSVTLRAVQYSLKLDSSKDLLLFTSSTGGQNIVLDTRSGQWKFYGIETQSQGKIVIELAKPSGRASLGSSQSGDLFTYRNRQGKSSRTIFGDMNEFKQRTFQLMQSKTQNEAFADYFLCPDPTWKALKALN